MCDHILLKGERKGLSCKKKLSRSSNVYCSTHYNKYEKCEINTCVVYEGELIMISGFMNSIPHRKMYSEVKNITSIEGIDIKYSPEDIKQSLGCLIRIVDYSSNKKYRLLAMMIKFNHLLLNLEFVYKHNDLKQAIINKLDEIINDDNLLNSEDVFIKKIYNDAMIYFIAYRKKILRELCNFPRCLDDKLGRYSMCEEHMECVEECG